VQGKNIMLLMGIPFVFVAVGLTGYVLMHGGAVPDPSDGWNCDHPNLSIMFGDASHHEICTDDSSAMFPCSFDCPPVRKTPFWRRFFVMLTTISLPSQARDIHRTC
jgi:hypothetical protein